MPPRSLWNGTISVGLINVPVKLYSAVESKTVHLREVHLADEAKLEHRRFCSAEGREVPYEEVVKGFEVGDGEYVVLDKDEIAAAAGDPAHIVDVQLFVESGEIDPVFYEKTYYLGAGKKGADAYRLLHDALGRTGRVGLGRFTFHNREYLAAIRSLDGVPDDFKDCYRARLEDVIARKRKGKRISAPKPEKEPSPVPDLMAALERSLAEATGDTGRSDGRKTAAGKGALADMSRDELYEQAQEQNVPGRSSMSKKQLVDALSR